MEISQVGKAPASEAGYRGFESIISSKRYLLFLVFIFLLGAVLRLYHLDKVPTGPISCELDVYNSIHSIVTTGKDVDGQLLPYLFQPANRRNAPIYGITEYFTTSFFGNNIYGLRLPAVIFGLLAIISIGLLTFELTQKKNVAYVAMLIQAISPIFIHFSRIAWAPASIEAFLLFGLYLFVNAFKTKVSYIKLALGTLILSLTAYTYPAGLLYAPLLGSFVILLNIKRIHWLSLPIMLFTYYLIVSPVITVFNKDWLTRQNTVSIETFGNGINLSSLKIFLDNYFSHFSWNYLVTTGNPTPALTWLYLNGFGAFYWWIIPLALIGIIISINKIRQWQYSFLLFWLIIYPLGGALTNEGGFTNPPRTLAAASIFCILAALGFQWLCRKPFNKFYWTILLINVILSSALFADFYFTKSIHINSNAWESGANETFVLAQKLSLNMDRLCVSTYWIGQQSYLTYYFSDSSIKIIQDINDGECSLPKTILITDPNNTIFIPDFKLITDIFDVDKNKEATIRVRF